MSGAYAWKQVYEEAILETDRYRLQERVAAAQAAIDVRLNELSQDGQAAGEEQIAIRDALNGLTVLRKEMQRESESPGLSRTP
jgi:hypothetical protein